MLLHAATSNPDEAIDLARNVEFVDKTTWDATYPNPHDQSASSEALQRPR